MEFRGLLRMNILLEWFTLSSSFAVFISIIINTAISIIGFIPSVFITVANITFFGFETGLVVSYIGECVGAAFSFVLYRKGIKKLKTKVLYKNKWLVKLRQTYGIDAFFIILILRILPLIPSGLITLTAALSTTTFMIFIFASCLGKLPALFIEAYSVKHIMESTLKENLLLALITFIIFILYLLIKRVFKTVMNMLSKI